MSSQPIRPAFRGLAIALGVALLAVGGFALFSGASFWDVVFPGIGAAVVFLDIGRRGR